MADERECPRVPVIRGDLLSSLGMEQIRVIYRRAHVEVLEVAMQSDYSVRKVIKKTLGLNDNGEVKTFWPSSELTIMHKITHPHVMKMDFAVISGFHIAICMPLCSEGSLDAMVEELYPQQVDRFFLQIACALRFLHDRCVIHGDVKPSNIFINGSDNAILGDLGQSRVLTTHEDTVTTWGGTDGYLGPEYEPHGDPFNPFLMDAYALGATMWVLEFGGRPDNLDHLGTVRTTPMPAMQRFVLTNLLQRDPRQRLSVHEILVSLREDENFRAIIDRL